MKFYECTPDRENPIRVFGLNPYYDGEGFSKCHKSILEAIPRIAGLGRRSCGGRICFRTDAEEFTLKMTLEQVTVDIGIPIYGASSADVYIGDRPTARFVGLMHPNAYSDTPVILEYTFRKSRKTEDITVILPRNETVVAFSVGIGECDHLLPPTPYRNERPVIFYGSSITEGGCPTRVGCNYVSLLSMRLNLDVLNFGFSGNARGDLQFADYIVKQNPAMVVYDYDHNSPSVKTLQETHETFYHRMRAAMPDVPILMMSRPDFIGGKEETNRRSIIRSTYQHAVAEGDELVRFLDGGRDFFPKEKLYECTIDTCHPNDTGFAYMADAVAPVILDYIH